MNALENFIVSALKTGIDDSKIKVAKRFVDVLSVVDGKAVWKDTLIPLNDDDWSRAVELCLLSKHGVGDVLFLGTYMGVMMMALMPGDEPPTTVPMSLVVILHTMPWHGKLCAMADAICFIETHADEISGVDSFAG